MIGISWTGALELTDFCWIASICFSHLPETLMTDPWVSARTESFFVFGGSVKHVENWEDDIDLWPPWKIKIFKSVESFDY